MEDDDRTTTTDMTETETDEYIPERILAMRIVKKQKQYRIKWLNCPDATWEIASGFDDDADYESLVQDFQIRQEEERKKPRAKKTRKTRQSQLQSGTQHTSSTQQMYKPTQRTNTRNEQTEQDREKPMETETKQLQLMHGPIDNIINSKYNFAIKSIHFTLNLCVEVLLMFQR